jgi:hypothetical protein
LPYLSTDDPAQFAMKIRADQHHATIVLGGAKDLFFIWASASARIGSRAPRPRDVSC